VPAKSRLEVKRKGFVLHPGQVDIFFDKTGYQTVQPVIDKSVAARLQQQQTDDQGNRSASFHDCPRE
jgi:hypothetical protein